MLLRKSECNSHVKFSQGLTWYPALVRLVPCVRPDVLLKVGELGELALADLATVRLDPEVDPRVLRQVGAVGEGLSACSTFVGFWLSQVNLSVKLEVGLAVESLKNKE